MDLINREDLLRHLDEEIRTAPNSIALNEAVEIRGYVNRMPKVDAVPVRHGRWLDCNDKDAPRNSWDGSVVDAYCSECGEWLVGSDEYSCDDNYCPHCGAKMDEEAESDGRNYR